MPSKPKTRKAPAALVFDTAKANATIARMQEFGRNKLTEAHCEMGDGLNFLELVLLAADAAMEDRADAFDCLGAAGTAVRAAVAKFNRANDLIDEFVIQMTQNLMRDPALRAEGK